MIKTFLLEIGCEEIPARMIPPAVDQLREGFRNELQLHHVPPVKVEVFATPRRLAVIIQGLPDRQPDRETQVTGPTVTSAFDASGEPTQAASGFARAQGVRVEDLVRVKRSRGEHVAVRKKIPGREIGDILASLIPGLIDSLNFAKTMRWGNGEHRFVRPVRWIVARMDSRLLEFSWAGVDSSTESRGHRRKGSRPLPIRSAGVYLKVLRRAGILPDSRERRAEIERQLAEAARQMKGIPVEDEELLETVTFLVERPLVIPGRFAKEFLDLPDEVLRTALRYHQKCFSLLDGEGKMLNGFLAVADAEADPQGTIRRGNEWVLAARLADAQFFWKEDRKTSLEARCRKLDRITFHKELGSYQDKTERMLILCERLAAGDRMVVEDLRTACRFAKADLTSHLVGEFPELQGTMGGLFAHKEGYPEAVSEAIYDQYLPRALGGTVPRSLVGALLGIADRLDTLTGLFHLGEEPSGSKDPFGLRRAAQGICKIAIELDLDLDLVDLVDESLKLQTSPSASGDPQGTRRRILEFFRERLAHVLGTYGHSKDEVEATLRSGAWNPRDAHSRAAALGMIRPDPDFEALAVAFKRVRNILQGQPEAKVTAEHFREPAEKDLFEAFQKIHVQVEKDLRERDYPEALRRIASMRGVIDRFFDKVLVMSKEAVIRRNRLALLQAVSNMFLEIADFSCMEIGENRPDREPS